MECQPFASGYVYLPVGRIHNDDIERLSLVLTGRSQIDVAAHSRKSSTIIRDVIEHPKPGQLVTFVEGQLQLGTQHLVDLEGCHSNLKIWSFEDDPDN